jgi:hypothetical protein
MRPFARIKSPITNSSMVALADRISVEIRLANGRAVTDARAKKHQEHEEHQGKALAAGQSCLIPDDRDIRPVVFRRSPYRFMATLRLGVLGALGVDSYAPRCGMVAAAKAERTARYTAAHVTRASYRKIRILWFSAASGGFAAG